jgi:hypothetical protein
MSTARVMPDTAIGNTYIEPHPASSCNQRDNRAFLSVLRLRIYPESVLRCINQVGTQSVHTRSQSRGMYSTQIAVASIYQCTLKAPRYRLALAALAYKVI